MFSRPEVGTREHIATWLGLQPSDEVFPWVCPRECACARYADAYGIPDWTNGEYPELYRVDGTSSELNEIARRVSHTQLYSHPTPRKATYGELCAAVREAWGL